MLKVRLVWLLIIIIAWGSQLGCARKTTSFQLVETSSTVIPSSLLSTSGIEPEVLISGGDTLLFMLNRKKREFYFIESKTGKLISTIPLSYLPQDVINATGGSVWFKVVSKDSIWISLLGNYRDDHSHDSLIYLLNAEGKPLKSYSIASHPLLPGENHERNDSSIYYWINMNRHIKGNKNHFLLSFTSYTSSYGEEFFYSYDWPLGAYLDVNSGEVHFCQGKRFPQPDSLGKNMWPSNYRFSHMAWSAKGTILFFFANQDSIYEYHPSKGWKKNIHLEPALALDNTPLPGPYKRSYPFKEGGTAYYHSFTDPYRNLIYRLASFGCNEEGVTQQKLVIYSSDFRLMGIADVPDSYLSNSMVVTPIGIGFVDQSNFPDSGTVTFRIFNLEETKEVLNPPLVADTCVKRQVKASGPSLRMYAEKMGVKTPSDTSQYQSFILIPTDKSCKSCFHTVQQFLFPRIDQIAQSNFHVIWAGPGYMSVKKSVEPNTITQPFLMDSKDIYLKHMEEFFNPRFFVLKGDSLIYDEVLDPDRIGYLPILIGKYTPLE